jgi:signal transduction histidine kinase
MASRVGYKTVGYFLPILILISIAGYLLYQSNLRSAHVEKESANSYHIDAAIEVLDDKLAEIARDLAYLSSFTPLRNAVESNSEKDTELLAEAFAQFLEHSNLYDQIRWIDESGMERVRVDSLREGPEIIPKDRLQDKCKRYYFTDAMRADTGEIFVSPLDLNIEQGKIEVPHKPMLRIASVVVDSRGDRRGIVILNYLGGLMLEEFRQRAAELPHGISLLNKDGYWLESPVGADEWGFMFGSEATFASRHPGVWSTIYSDEAGQFATETGLWSFRTVYPLSLRMTSSTGAAGATEASVAQLRAGEYFWKAVSFDASHAAVSSELRQPMLAGVAGVLLLAFLGCLLVAINKTKRELADDMHREAQRQIEKAESLGRMAGAVAHKFNNQLFVVTGNLELALADMPADASQRHSLSEALEAARRSAETSSLMLSYLGQREEIGEPINLPEACRRNLLSLKSTVGDGIHLESKFIDGKSIVRASPNQIQQVISALLTNAIEAIGDNGGKIAVTTRTVCANDIPGTGLAPPDWRPVKDRYACIEVADTGCGIAEKDLGKIFDPFFTTKFMGRGLGLALVQGILRQLEGAISIDSREGNGATFRAFFPLTDGAVS